MNFYNWFLQESTLPDLYQSTLSAFPNTTKRQHITNTIKITNINWVPFLGLKTLFVKGLAQNEGKEYNPIIVFKKVVYNENEQTSLIASNGKKYNLKQLSFDENEVLLRCNCPDFYWRFNFYNSEDKSLHGRKRAKYEGQGSWKANPLEYPGMCKHIMKLIKTLTESKIIR